MTFSARTMLFPHVLYSTGRELPKPDHYRVPLCYARFNFCGRLDVEHTAPVRDPTQDNGGAQRAQSRTKNSTGRLRGYGIECA